jgi:hypothetical protein
MPQHQGLQHHSRLHSRVSCSTTAAGIVTENKSAERDQAELIEPQRQPSAQAATRELETESWQTATDTTEQNWGEKQGGSVKEQARSRAGW